LFLFDFLYFLCAVESTLLYVDRALYLTVSKGKADSWPITPTKDISKTSVSKGYDGWLHNGSNVAVVAPPDAAIMPAAVRFELAERSEVVYDNRNND
jgi:hypothetical protein